MKSWYGQSKRDLNLPSSRPKKGGLECYEIFFVTHGRYDLLSYAFFLSYGTDGGQVSQKQQAVPSAQRKIPEMGPPMFYALNLVQRLH